MKNSSQFIVELFVTGIVAFLLSTVSVLILSFVFANIDSYGGSEVIISSVGGVIFGLVVGYKLNSLVKQYKK